jgi:hypothetical protein
MSRGESIRAIIAALGYLRFVLEFEYKVKPLGRPKNLAL